jgi:hypothetical protein
MSNYLNKDKLSDSELVTKDGEKVAVHSAVLKRYFKNN